METNHNTEMTPARVVQALRREAMAASRNGDHVTAADRFHDLGWYARMRCQTGFGETS